MRAGDLIGQTTHRFIETNGIHMHIVEQGTGPLLLLCHGFPELWYSWRYQLGALASAGYHVVAPDQRGYGQTSRPAESAAYTTLHLVGDLVGLLDALGEEHAVLIGHDWGANVAWLAALMRPDRFERVVILSAPYVPRGPVIGPAASTPPSIAMSQMAGDRSFYQLYFQQPGVAEAELERDVRLSMRKVLYAASGSASEAERWRPIQSTPNADFLSAVPDPAGLPDWLSEADLDYYTEEFERTGFSGGLNWYRNIDRNWELLAAYSRAKITQPTLFIWGDRDPALDISGISTRIERMHRVVPHLDTLKIDGSGHWIQQEKAHEVNAAIINFLSA